MKFTIKLVHLKIDERSLLNNIKRDLHVQKKTKIISSLNIAKVSLKWPPKNDMVSLLSPGLGLSLTPTKVSC